MKLYLQCLAVAGCGALGALTRFWIQLAFGKTLFPVATLLINVTGCLLVGWLAAFLETRPELRMVIAVGFVGAFTTFSTYIFDSNALINDGAFLVASLNLLGSIALGLVALRAGIWLGAR